MSDAAAILIFGPTGSGKSALALALAERHDGTVINADSMQVYRELRILTARPSSADETSVPHALYGFVPACEAYSAGRYMADAVAAMAKARSEGRVPVLVGGTGLYFKALTDGLSPMPPVAQDVRDHWRGEAERLGAEALHGVLAGRDAIMAARLNPSDTQRIVRALEVLESSGRSLAVWQSEPGTAAADVSAAVKLVVIPERDQLHARTDARFDRMMAAGALAEAEALAGLQLDAALPAMRGLGVVPLIAAVRGTLAVEAAIAAAKAETRQYAKRQSTWARRYMMSWKAISTKQMEQIAAKGIAFIDR